MRTETLPELEEGRSDPGDDQEEALWASLPPARNNPHRLIGKKYGRLEVVDGPRLRSFARQRAAVWRCSCRCGGSVVTRTSNLRSGATRSCGCAHLELISTPKPGRIRHEPIHAFGRTMTPTRWAHELDVHVSSIYRRLARGLTGEAALAIVPRARRLAAGQTRSGLPPRSEAGWAKRSAIPTHSSRTLGGDRSTR